MKIYVDKLPSKPEECLFADWSVLQRCILPDCKLGRHSCYKSLYIENDEQCPYLEKGRACK